ncbi:MAG: TonB-dependent receptor plug domain-containing protein [Gemmatimonadaceae bacterium]
MHISISRAAALSLAALTLLPSGMAAQQPTTLDTVHVHVASRTAGNAAASTRSVEIITRAQIRASAARTISDLLATHPGIDVQTRSNASADLAIRGSSLEQVLVLVDGVRMTDQQTGHFDLDLAIPLGIVDHIEILRGAGSTLYGPAAVGGVINIVTRRDVGWSRASVHGGSFGTLGAAVAGAKSVSATDMRVAADFERSDGFRPGTDYRMLQASVSAEHELGAGRLAADLGLGARDFGAADFYGPYPSYEDTRTTVADMRWNTEHDAGWNWSAAASARRHGDLFTLFRDQPGIYQNHHVSWQNGAEVVARRTAGAVSVDAGADAYDLTLTSARLGNHAETRTAAFSELVYAPGAAVIRGGLRLDESSIFGAFLSPALSAALPIGRAVTLRASVDRGFRPPTWTERYYTDPANVGDSLLSPERFWTGEVGVHARAGRGLYGDVATYVRRATDLIDWVKPDGAPPTTPWQTMNVDHATYRGIEAGAGGPTPLGISWTASGSWLAFSAADAQGYVGKYALRPATRTYGGSVITGPIHDVSLGLNVMHLDRPGEPGYLYATLRVVTRVRHLRIWADVMNLTNASYLDAAADPAAGRALYFGIARNM